MDNEKINGFWVKIFGVGSKKSPIQATEGYLVEGEEIIYEVEGSKHGMGTTNLFVTDRRVIFECGRGLLSPNWHIKDIDFRHISSIEYKIFRFPIFLIFGILSFGAALINDITKISIMPYDIVPIFYLFGILFIIIYIFAVVTAIVFITAAESYDVRGLSEKSIQDIIKIVRERM